MGCWNEVCAVSGFPIFEGEPVVGMLTMGDKPMPFWWFGNYDEYGWYEIDVALMGSMEQKMFGFLRKYMVERPAKNIVDGEILSNDLNWDNLREWIHRDRFFLNYYGNVNDINNIFIHRDVWDGLVSTKVESGMPYDDWLAIDDSLRQMYKIHGDDNFMGEILYAYMGYWFDENLSNKNEGWFDIAYELVVDVITEDHHVDVAASELSRLFQWRWVLHILGLAGKRIVVPVHIGQSDNTRMVHHVNGICAGVGSRESERVIINID